MNVKECVARHVQTLPPSGIRKFFDIVNEMDDAISLSVGEPGDIHHHVSLLTVHTDPLRIGHRLAAAG